MVVLHNLESNVLTEYKDKFSTGETLEQAKISSYFVDHLSDFEQTLLDSLSSKRRTCKVHLQPRERIYEKKMEEPNTLSDVTAFNFEKSMNLNTTMLSRGRFFGGGTGHGRRRTILLDGGSSLVVNPYLSHNN